MSQKRWKLVLTELGSAVALQETVVEASDWMTALTRARKQIGERGGVPPGASCAIAPDGRATIVDAVARRQYLLQPTAEELSSAAPAAPAAPVAAAPPAAAAPEAAAPAGKKPRLSKATMAYLPSPVASAAPPIEVAVGTPVAPASVPPSATSRGSVRPVAVPRPSDRPDPKKTVSYSTAEVRAAAELHAGQASAPQEPVSQPPVAGPPVAGPPVAGPPVAGPPVSGSPVSGPPVSGPPVAAAPVGPSPKKRVSRQTMAYMPAEIANAIANQTAVVVGAPSAPVAAPAPESVSVAPVSVAPVSVAPVSVAPVSVAPVAPISVAPLPAVEATPSDGTELLHSRDAEPTKESPLVYRERHYLVAAGLPDDEAEMILRRKFAALREELASRPKGKLVKMALFDHRFTGQPQRPPILALQWKDWRGEPEVIAPGRATVPAPAPTASVPPAAPPLASPSTPPLASPSTPPLASPSTPPLASPSTPPLASQSSVIVDPNAYTPSVAPVAPAPVPSIVVDASAYRPSQSAPPVAPPQSVVVDASAYTASPGPISVQPVAPARAPVHAPIQTATGSSRRSRKATPGGALTDDRLADAFEGLQDLFFLTSAFEGVEFVVRLIGELIPSEAISVALYDINTHELRFVSTTGPGAEERKGDAVPIGAGLLGAAVADWMHSLVVSDVASDARFDPGIDGRVGLDAVNMLFMPIAAQGRLLALVQLSNRIGDLEYSQSDANLIQYIGGRLGEFLLQTKMTADRPSKRAPTASR